MKKLFVAVSVAILSFPAFAADGSAAYELSQADLPMFGSAGSKRDIFSAASAGELAYWAGPTSAIGPQDVGGTDARRVHADARKGETTVGTIRDATRLPTPLRGPTSHIGNDHVGGVDVGLNLIHFPARSSGF
jgi:hypothetical protein